MCLGSLKLPERQPPMRGIFLRTRRGPESQVAIVAATLLHLVWASCQTLSSAIQPLSLYSPRVVSSLSQQTRRRVGLWSRPPPAHLTISPHSTPLRHQFHVTKTKTCQCHPKRQGSFFCLLGLTCLLEALGSLGFHGNPSRISSYWPFLPTSPCTPLSPQLHC